MRSHTGGQAARATPTQNQPHSWSSPMKYLLSFLLLAPALVAVPADPPAPATRFDGLGTHSRKVATESADAQAYFDQGLAFLYAFNHDEAIRSFEQAAALEPTCAMAHWGVALACGGHINKPVMPPDRAKKAFEAAKLAE